MEICSLKYDRNNIYFTPHWIHFRVFNSCINEIYFFFILRIIYEPSSYTASFAIFIYIQLWAKNSFYQIHITFCYVAPVYVWFEASGTRKKKIFFYLNIVSQFRIKSFGIKVTPKIIPTRQFENFVFYSCYPFLLLWFLFRFSL